ncbi:hypothetical protein ACTJKK_03115 [Microbacterium sp. 22179]|uniref:hypothetical protein n=1 Tax=Microbacterium sp. 22179 TaxID=3453886 RepID=UPI003F834BE6
MPRQSKPGRGEVDPPPSTGYPSAYDIPDFKHMREQMAGMRALLALKPSLRADFKKIEREHQRIVGTVESFYRIIGDRHWVFHGSLHLDSMATAVSAGDPETVEESLIAQYQDEQRMKYALMRAKNVREMRPRSQMLDAAFRDHLEGRYYAVVLVLLAVMDGFVNDVGSQRRGLHTRDGEELVAWNSVTAHHQGLAATQKSFTKSFNKTSAEPVYELYRNGIMHGNLTNFNNVVVASKAWNRLFSLIDWAQAIEQAKKPIEPEPTFRESLAKMADIAADRKKMAAWKPRTRSVVADGLEKVMSEPVVVAAASMLDAWIARNYGQLAPFLYEFTKPKSKNAFIGEVRSRFAATPLESFQVLGVDVRGPGLAHVTVGLTVDGVLHESELRWLYVDGDKHTRVEGDPRGTWQVIQTDPLSIVGRKW